MTVIQKTKTDEQAAEEEEEEVAKKTMKNVDTQTKRSPTIWQ